MKRYEALEKTGGFFETKLRVHKPPGFRTKFTNAIPSAHFVLKGGREHDSVRTEQKLSKKNGIRFLYYRG